MNRVVGKVIAACSADPLLGAIRLQPQSHPNISQADRAAFIRGGAAISVCSLITVIIGAL